MAGKEAAARLADAFLGLKKLILGRCLTDPTAFHDRQAPINMHVAGIDLQTSFSKPDTVACQTPASKLSIRVLKTFMDSGREALEFLPNLLPCCELSLTFMSTGSVGFLLPFIRKTS